MEAVESLPVDKVFGAEVSNEIDQSGIFEEGAESDGLVAGGFGFESEVGRESQVGFGGEIMGFPELGQGAVISNFSDGAG